jgi:hypothetical protein
VVIAMLAEHRARFSAVHFDGHEIGTQTHWRRFWRRNGTFSAIMLHKTTVLLDALVVKRTAFLRSPRGVWNVLPSLWSLSPSRWRKVLEFLIRFHSRHVLPWWHLC